MMADGEAVLTPRLDRPARPGAARRPDTADTGYVVPSEGTLFWMDTWVMLADAPHPNAAYAWLDFIQRPEIQGEETNYNLLRHAERRRRRSSSRRSCSPTRRSSRRRTSIAKLEGAEDTSGNTQRIDIWEEFKSKIGG